MRPQMVIAKALVAKLEDLECFKVGAKSAGSCIYPIFVLVGLPEQGVSQQSYTVGVCQLLIDMKATAA